MTQNGNSMRIGIATKIFGGMFILVLVMVAAAMTSMLLVRQVTEELTFVEGAYLPMARSVATVAAIAFEQEAQFERSLAKIKRARPGDPNAAIETYLALGARLDREVDAALAMLREAEATTANPDHRVALVRLEAKLTRLEREHQDIEDEGLRILEVLRSGQAEFGDALLERLEIEQAEFDAVALEAAEGAANLADEATASALANERQVLRINVLLTTLAAILGLLFGTLIVRGLTRPVRDLLLATDQIERGNLEVQVPVVSRDEIGDLARSFNHMVGELRSKEQIKDTFGRYVDPRIVESLIDRDEGAMVAGESAVFTVYFSDIAGFTPIAERLTPSGLVTLINAYLTAMSVPLRESKGIIDKYIGDAIMAYWGPPFCGSHEHARLACGAALLQQSVLAEFQTQVPELTGLRRDFPIITTRIGIATGEVVVGSIGSDISRNYTVMGDTVNLGARLESLNKAYGTHILVSAHTEQEARDAFVFREIDSVAVVGKTEPARIYELMATIAGADTEQLALRDTFEQALEHYRRQAWDEAEAALAECRERAPDDGPVAVYLDRIAMLRASPPPADWDGVWRATSK